MTSHAHDHGHDAHHSDHGHHGEGGADHGSLKSYMIGFVLAVILTAIPFAIVMGGGFEDKRITVALITLFAVVQIIVHMIYFLHMNPKSEGGWTMLAMIFTLVVVVITISGTLWVMYHMNANMMPHHLPVE